MLKAQEPLGSFTVKKGVYITFRDIRNNQPLADTTLKIKERAGVAFGNSGDFKLESDSLSHDELSDLKMKFVGFSDGQDFYVSDRFTIGGVRGLSKCFLKGPYILADVEKSGPSSSGIGESSAIYEYVINVNKGLSLKLTRKVLEDILGRYPDIESEYKEKKKLMDHAKEILQKINEKETIQGNEKKQ